MARRPAITIVAAADPRDLLVGASSGDSSSGVIAEVAGNGLRADKALAMYRSVEALGGGYARSSYGWLDVSA
jgi:hypothetical protein